MLSLPAFVTKLSIVIPLVPGIGILPIGRPATKAACKGSPPKTADTVAAVAMLATAVLATAAFTPAGTAVDNAMLAAVRPASTTGPNSMVRATALAISTPILFIEGSLDSKVLISLKLNGS